MKPEEKEVEVSTEEETVENPEDSQEKEIDYKAEKEKLETKLGQAGHNIEEERAKRIAAEKKVEQAEEDKEKAFEDNESSIEDARIELAKKNKENIDSLRADLLKDVVSEELNSLTDNQDERDLVKVIYDNELANKGSDRASIRESLENARILANKTRLTNAIKEADSTIKSNESMGGGEAAGADNANAVSDDPELDKISDEMSGDLPRGFK